MAKSHDRIVGAKEAFPKDPRSPFAILSLLRILRRNLR
jgi:hypothetical protein